MKDFFTYLALFSVATILVFLLRGLYLKNLSIQNKKNAGQHLKKQKTIITIITLLKISHPGT